MPIKIDKDLVCKAPITNGIYAIVKFPKLFDENSRIIWNWKLEIKIYFSNKRFDAYYKSCKDNNKLIWSRELELNSLSNDLAIKYISNLITGYYLIDLSLKSIKDTYISKSFYYFDSEIEPYIIIGLPYSIYKSIQLKKV